MCVQRNHRKPAPASMDGEMSRRKKKNRLVPQSECAGFLSSVAVGVAPSAADTELYAEIPRKRTLLSMHNGKSWRKTKNLFTTDYVARPSIPRYALSVNYFGFGSNMHLGHVMAWIHDHGGDPAEIRNPRRAILRHHRLRTNYFSVGHGAGAANIDPVPGDVVEGVLMSVTPAIQKLLRRKEGWPRCYQECLVTVEASGRRRKIRAFTYIVAAVHRLPIDLPVTREYRRFILDAASEFDFSASYRRELQRLLRIGPRTTRSCSTRLT